MWIVTMNSGEGWECTEETLLWFFFFLDAELWLCCSILLRGAAVKSLCARLSSALSVKLHP